MVEQVGAEPSLPAFKHVPAIPVPKQEQHNSPMTSSKKEQVENGLVEKDQQQAVDNNMGQVSAKRVPVAVETGQVAEKTQVHIEAGALARVAAKEEKGEPMGGENGSVDDFCVAEVLEVDPIVFQNEGSSFEEGTGGEKKRKAYKEVKDTSGRQFCPVPGCTRSYASVFPLPSHL